MKTWQIQRTLRFLVAALALSALAACNNDSGGGSSSGNRQLNRYDQYGQPQSGQIPPNGQQQPYGQQQPGQQGQRPQGYIPPGGVGSIPPPQGQARQGQVPQGPNQQVPAPQAQVAQNGQGSFQRPEVVVRPLNNTAAPGAQGTAAEAAVVSETTAQATAAKAWHPIDSRDAGVRPSAATQTGSAAVSGNAASAGTIAARPIEISNAGVAQAPVAATATVAVAAESEVSHSIPVSSGEVSGSGVAGTQGPGWPANKPFALEPLKTGAFDESGEAFTDAKDDSIMATLVKKMNELPQVMRKDSFELADLVRSVDFEARGSEAMLDLTLINDGKSVQVTFRGQLSGDRRGRLVQIPRAPDLGFKFNARVACMDADARFCRQAALTIEQVQEQTICRRIFIVHRSMVDGFGDGHVTISQEDYTAWSRIQNKSHRAFARLMANTAHATKVKLGEIPQERLRSPRLEYLGVRSWAVAYGPAFFEVLFSKADGNLGTRGDTTRIFGPLTTHMRVPQEPSVAGPAGGYRDAQVDEQFDERFDRSISGIALMDNDGRGNITLKIDFYGEVEKDGQKTTETNSSTTVNFSSQRLDVVDRATMEQLIQ